MNIEPTHIEATGWIISEGIKMPRDDRFLTSRIAQRLEQNKFSKHLSPQVLDLARKDDRVLELGSGIGYLAALLSAKTSVAQIHCYDGNKDALAYADAMLATNGLGNVTLAHGVLGKRKGTRAFFLKEPFMRSSLIETDDSTREVVPMHNAKSVFAAVKPTFLICDIEGDEAEVLALPDLSSVDRAIIRLNPAQIGHNGVAGIFDVMTKAGLTYDATRSVRSTVVFHKGTEPA